METPTRTPAHTTRLERPVEGRVLAGVAAGVARRAGWSVGLVRIGFLVAALFGGVGILLYLAAWALMPEAGETDSATDRWLVDLGDPNRRTGAILIGIAAGVVIVVLAPITSIAVVALVIGAAVLAAERKRTAAPTPGTEASDDEAPTEHVAADATA